MTTTTTAIDISGMRKAWQHWSEQNTAGPADTELLSHFLDGPGAPILSELREQIERDMESAPLTHWLSEILEDVTGAHVDLAIVQQPFQQFTQWSVNIKRLSPRVPPDAS